MTEALWFASRACGLVTLLLVTARRGPRRAAHRPRRDPVVAAVRAAVAAPQPGRCSPCVFLAVHVATATIDPYAGIRWWDAVVPFASTYHPFWTGLGAAAADLLVALVLTSILRTWLPLPLWRGVHFAAYALWPVALAHGLGIGGATARAAGCRSIDGGCALVVVVAVVIRLRARHPDTEMRRMTEMRLR